MMKVLLSGVILASTMLLTACGGGDSDSSGSTHAPIMPTSTFKKVLLNQNEYRCPTEASNKACEDEASCKANGCTLIKEVTKKCTVNGNNIYGTKGQDCMFSIENYNKGAESILKCDSSGRVNVGGISAGSKFTLGNKTLSCQ